MLLHIVLRSREVILIKLRRVEFDFLELAWFSHRFIGVVLHHKRTLARILRTLLILHYRLRWPLTIVSFTLYIVSVFIGIEGEFSGLGQFVILQTLEKVFLLGWGWFRFGFFGEEERVFEYFACTWTIHRFFLQHSGNEIL